MADNYTALKSSQKKRIISKETFNSLDLSTIPVGSEYEVVNPIEKGDLSADINNALNKADNALPKPTNDTTGSVGDVLSKTANGSEWKTIKTLPDTVPSFGDVLSSTTVGTPIWVSGAVFGIYNHYMSFDTGSGEHITLTKISTRSDSFSSLAEAYLNEIAHLKALGDLALLIPVVGSIYSNSQTFSAIAINGDVSILFYESGQQIDISDLINWADEPIQV